MVFGWLFKEKKTPKNEMESRFEKEMVQVGLQFSSTVAKSELAREFEENLKKHAEFFSIVRERLIEKEVITAEHYDTYELELKRFFFLTCFVKDVPMYNEKVDAIWHEMIIFTRKYAAFCQDIAGRMIHHEPTIGEKGKVTEGVKAAKFLYFYELSFRWLPNSEVIYEWARGQEDYYTRRQIGSNAIQLIPEYTLPVTKTEKEFVASILHSLEEKEREKQRKYEEKERLKKVQEEKMREERIRRAAAQTVRNARTTSSSNRSTSRDSRSSDDYTNTYLTTGLFTSTLYDSDNGPSDNAPTYTPSHSPSPSPSYDPPSGGGSNCSSCGGGGSD